MAFKHVSFLTYDLERTLAFYDLLGAERLKREQTHEGHDRAVIRLGGVKVQFFGIEGQNPAPHPHWAEHLALEVDALPELAAQLEAAGYQLSRPLGPSPSGRLMAFVLDLDGRSVELLQK